MVSVLSVRRRPLSVRRPAANRKCRPFLFRISGSRPPRPGPRHPLRGVQEQEMGLQLERERARTDHVQVPGTVCRPQEIPYCQGGTVPVQEHVPVGECRRPLALRYLCSRLLLNRCRRVFLLSRSTLVLWRMSSEDTCAAPRNVPKRPENSLNRLLSISTTWTIWLRPRVYF